MVPLIRCLAAKQLLNLLQAKIYEVFTSPGTRKKTILVEPVNTLQIRVVDDVRYFWVIIVPETAAVEPNELNDNIAGYRWAMTRHLSEALKTHCNAA